MLYIYGLNNFLQLHSTYEIYTEYMYFDLKQGIFQGSMSLLLTVKNSQNVWNTFVEGVKMQPKKRAFGAF